MTSDLIFNIGFNKSGSKSLALALNLLDIPTLHHHTNNKIPLHEIIRNNALNNKNLFDSLDLKYRGFCDFGGFEHTKQLFSQYPNAKFILTLRPLEDWLYSTYHNFGLTNHRQTTKDEFLTESTKFYHNNLLMVNDFFKSYPKKLLIFKPCQGEGWIELCNFLQKEVPAMPFPWKNKTRY